MAQLLSQRKYAGHRGVTLRAVQKAIKAKRITLVVDPDTKKLMIDPAIADAQWTRNTDLDQQLRGNGGMPPAGPTGALDLQPGSGDDEDVGEREELLRHKTQSAKADAQLKTMQALERAGALVLSAGVRREAIDTARRVRNVLMAMSDELAPILDPASPDRARSLIDEYMKKKVIGELTRGLAERAAAESAAATEPDPALV
jgi:hypothetical protein